MPEWQNGQKFTTYDQDNDIYGDNCAEVFRGGWWYGGCHRSNLNGHYYNGSHSAETEGMGINWFTWKGYKYSLPKTEIKIRPNSIKATPKDCIEVKLSGKNTSGMYEIDPDGNGKFGVYCDMDTDGGGKDTLPFILNFLPHYLHTPAEIRSKPQWTASTK